MTYPTAREMDEIQEAPPRIRAALEFMWVFTEWWHSLDVDIEDIPGDLDIIFEMERAYERWWNLR